MLAAVDAVVWPAVWIAVIAAVAVPTGVVGPVVVAACVLSALGRLRRAVWENERYWFTTWRWGRVAMVVWLVGVVMKLSTPFELSHGRSMRCVGPRFEPLVDVRVAPSNGARAETHGRREQAESHQAVDGGPPQSSSAPNSRHPKNDHFPGIGGDGGCRWRGQLHFQSPVGRFANSRCAVTSLPCWISA